MTLLSMGSILLLRCNGYKYAIIDTTELFHVDRQRDWLDGKTDMTKLYLLFAIL